MHRSNGEFLFQLFNLGFPKKFSLSTLNTKIERLFSKKKMFCLHTSNTDKVCMGLLYALSTNILLAIVNIKAVI